MTAQQLVPPPRDRQPGLFDHPALVYLADWMASARSHRVICLVAGIWLTNAFDLLLTLLSAKDGLLIELNPIARHMLEEGAFPLVCYKIGLVLIGTYPFLRFRHTRIAELGALTCLCLYAVLAVHWNTCYEVFTLADTGNLSWQEYQRLIGP
ncbi:MAG: hypothetical protein JSV78_08090 [Phycisphaerales bacterium]|nr:MAG: hypothetical protein JSV78_08090 [Phycisphaerales bacterium]